jgi:hypothetical protein
MTYKLTWDKSKFKDKHQQYLALLKQVMYTCEENIVPIQFYCDQKALSTVIDPELLARRLGLIVFEYKTGHNIQSCPQQKYILQNTSDSQMFLYTRHLKSDKIEPIQKDELLLVLPPKFKTEISLDFTNERGCDNARSSTFEGFRYDSNQNEFSLLFDQVKDLNVLSSNCNTLIEEFRNES